MEKKNLVANVVRVFGWTSVVFGTILLLFGLFCFISGFKMPFPILVTIYAILFLGIGYNSITFNETSRKVVILLSVIAIFYFLFLVLPGILSHVHFGRLGEILPPERLRPKKIILILQSFSLFNAPFLLIIFCFSLIKAKK